MSAQINTSEMAYEILEIDDRLDLCRAAAKETCFSDDKLASMSLANLLGLLEDHGFSDVAARSIEKRYYEKQRAINRGKLVLADSVEIVEKPAEDCASEIMEHFVSFRSLYSQDLTVPTAIREGVFDNDNNETFLKTFDITTPRHAQIHEAFLRRLTAYCESEGVVVSELKPTEVLVNDSQLFTKKKVVAHFPEVTLLRSGLLNSSSDPHFLNYQAIPQSG